MNKWECIITRRLQVTRPTPTFYDYTDWFSDVTSGRINPINWGDYILAIGPSFSEPQAISTVSGELIEEVRL